MTTTTTAPPTTRAGAKRATQVPSVAPGTPPGVTRTGPGHGLGAPVQALTPFAQLRKLLDLSYEVPDEHVYLTAIDEITKLREGQPEPTPWPTEDAPPTGAKPRAGTKL